MTANVTHGGDMRVPLSDPHLTRIVRNWRPRNTAHAWEKWAKEYHDDLWREEANHDGDEDDIPAWDDPKVQSALAKLDPEDRYVLKAYFRDHAIQKDIAEVLGMGQSAVCYRIIGASFRLKWWSRLPPAPTDERLKELLTPRQYEIVQEYRKDLSQLRTAERLTAAGRTTSQSTVCIELRHAVARCEGEDEVAHRWLKYIQSGAWITRCRGVNWRRGRKKDVHYRTDKPRPRKKVTARATQTRRLG